MVTTALSSAAKAALFVICACVCLSANAQSQKAYLPFEAEAAKALVTGDATALEQKRAELETSAFKSYAESKLSKAATDLYYSEFLGDLAGAASAAPEGLKLFFLSRPDLVEEFYSELKPQDNRGDVYAILSKIWEKSPEKFALYPKLAIAIAIVFDAPPPKEWPHHQVSAEILPRVFPDPEAAFASWVALKDKGRLLYSPDKLAIAELKFTVSSISSDADKAWVQKSVSVNLAGIPKLYSSINYDNDRLKREAYDWEKSDYKLETIKKYGGICTDQAYFTAEAAKARGVPAFILSGAGADGFHAWTAYMAKPGEWNFEVGRYEGARFVTGRTLDPQTWQEASDHEIEGMGANFKSLPKYADNLRNTLFAKKFLDKKDYAAAEAAAKAAAAVDGRNAETWDIYIAAAEGRNATQKELREIYTNAIKSFFKYPDSDAYFRERLIKNLNAENAQADAKKLTSSIIIKTKQSRPDLAMRFAREELAIDIKSGDAKTLASSYKRLLGDFKNEGGITFTGITVPIVEELLKAGKKDDAAEIAKITRQILKPEKQSTLDINLTRIETFIKNFKTS